MPDRMLVLGGTQFIGRAFCQQVLSHSHFQLTLLNRGQTNPDLFAGQPRLVCDRHDPQACRQQLNGQYWDYVVDFSGHNHYQIENVVTNCRFGHYTFVSTSAVELSWPEDELFGMAQDKLWCEHLLQNATPNLLIIRPGFVVGPLDPSHRFEFRAGVWVWSGTQDPVQPVVQLNLLVRLMLELMGQRHTGVVRAGYSAGRITPAEAMS